MECLSVPFAEVCDKICQETDRMDRMTEFLVTSSHGLARKGLIIADFGYIVSVASISMIDGGLSAKADTRK